MAGPLDRALIAARYLMLTSPEQADRTLAVHNAKAGWEEAHGSLAGRWFGVRYPSGQTYYHWTDAEQTTGRTQTERPEEPVVTVFDSGEEPLSSWLWEQWELIEGGAWPDCAPAESERWFLTGPLAATAPAFEPDFLRSFSAVERPHEWSGCRPSPTMTDGLLLCHRQNLVPGNLTARLLGTFRLLGALGGGELDEVAKNLAAGFARSADKLLMLATNTADQRGRRDVVVAEWERAHEEFEAQLEAALGAPDPAAYADALFRARPAGTLALIWSHWLIRHPRHGDEMLRTRARGAERQIDEDLVRCLDAWWVRLNDVFYDGHATSGLISRVRSAWDGGGRREAVRTAERICRRERLLPLAEVDALVTSAQRTTPGK
ncbi:hypothetical protein [Paractinoplanes lichenicola]|uniref:Uncharacterized protein n=1 Tax=Paractinoplanes lichenicola TaxID=2802976 RepID=A0ABS1VVL6_9ACTN|nr:hypothetical protein [Actinoplanes lichenicola]MBL7258509.1 hypothetical protein [Actinoplanes lichenicola]